MTKLEKKKYYHNYYICNKNKILKYWKLYRLNNKDKLKNRDSKYYQKNKEKCLKQNKDYNKLHTEKIKKYWKKYQQDNKNKIAEYQKIYREKYKDLLNEYRTNKYKNSINFRLICCLRNRLIKVLKRNTKSESTIKLLGCSIKYLKQYLEKQFKSGMTWKNYGKWEIDHIRPCASFDLRKVSEQHKCFHYTNLQPLWEQENLKKGIKC